MTWGRISARAWWMYPRLVRLATHPLTTIMSAPKVSFTVRRPSPVSRQSSDSEGPSFKVPTLPKHLRNESPALGSPLSRSEASTPQYYDNSSSGEDDEIQDELVTGFDKFGVQRCVDLLRTRKQPSQLTVANLSVFCRRSVSNRPHKKAAQGPLVIPATKNRDWREQARKRRGQSQYVPESAKAKTGADGSVGGLGTKDTINSGPVLSGLQFRKKREHSDHDVVEGEEQEDVKMEVVEETEDERALRAVLASANGETNETLIPAILPAPMSETDALRQDVEELPESATLDDYARVPIHQFGAALLRGMGWKEGQAASRKPGKGLIEPYLPESRPALLGIGAKEQEAVDDGSKYKGSKRPERRYVPVVKVDKDGQKSSEPRRHRSRERSPRREDTSRRGSPDRRSSRDDRPRDRDRDFRRDRERDYDYDRRDRRRDDDKPYERRRDRDGDGDDRRRSEKPSDDRRTRR